MKFVLAIVLLGFSGSASAFDDTPTAADCEALATCRDKADFDAARAAQRKWIAFRDASCKVPRALMRHGSIIGPIEASCEVTFTGRQANQLDNYPRDGWY